MILGALFGFLLTKSEVISWYRIQEMFRFQSFHIFGILG
ncbi:MAG: YeeE/YedE family protein, partial [Gemmatimonadetes bacterium]|nr:YeeE/YedE family protein [Gemmatimonadota bacterium]